MSAEKTHYSSEELQVFKKLIIDKMEEAKSNLDFLKGSYSSENNTNDTSPQFKLMEDAESLSKEEIGQLMDREKRYIQSLEGALVRIENKTYGICRVTGKIIPRERLMIVPHATLSIEAKQGKV